MKASPPLDFAGPIPHTGRFWYPRAPHLRRGCRIAPDYARYR